MGIFLDVDCMLIRTLNKTISLLSIWEFQAQGACFSLYKAFFKWYTLSSSPSTTKPSGYSTYTSSSSMPFKNADLTSSWYIFQLWCATREINILTKGVISSVWSVWSAIFHIKFVKQFLCIFFSNIWKCHLVAIIPQSWGKMT